MPKGTASRGLWKRYPRAFAPSAGEGFFIDGSSSAASRAYRAPVIGGYEPRGLGPLVGALPGGAAGSAALLSRRAAALT